MSNFVFGAVNDTDESLKSKSGGKFGLNQGNITKIEVLTNAELGIDPATVGFKGSPTSVKTTFTKDVTDKTEVFTLSEQETADMIAKTLKEKQIITK